MKRLCNQADFDKLAKTTLQTGILGGEEIVSNFNNNNCITKNTKIIILGTITPPEGNGYFYTAPRNRIYGYIDEAFNITSPNLVYYKKQLQQNKGDTRIVNSIIEVLKSLNIAFLDVMKEVIRKSDSPFDSDIIHFTLDEKAFIESNKVCPNAVILCNSKLALDCFNQIKNNNGLKFDKVIYLSQRSGKKEQWSSILKI